MSRFQNQALSNVEPVQYEWQQKDCFLSLSLQSIEWLEAKHPPHPCEQIQTSDLLYHPKRLIAQEKIQESRSNHNVMTVWESFRDNKNEMYAFKQMDCIISMFYVSTQSIANAWNISNWTQNKPIDGIT